MDAPYDVVPTNRIMCGQAAGPPIWRRDWTRKRRIRTVSLPTTDVNIRRVEVNNATNPPSFIIGENHHGKIAVVQPLNKQER